MHNRRDFITQAAALAGTMGLTNVLTMSIQQAQAIAPTSGSTYLDAEHVVILMQENRSFDHAYGSLSGVRGFNDPRAITLPDGNPVWVQTNDAKQSYSPFRLNIKDTQATWMGCLPHSWSDQVDARNGGKYDQWLQAKRSGEKTFAEMPLTMGYYNREDIPFYYALADAFTICDQHFCSALTGTTPNRLYLWTGSIRAKPSADSPAHVLNSDADYDHAVGWTTFPERLEQAGVSWKIYQNELSLDVGLSGEEAAWLANFGDNAIEYFSQFNVRYLPTYRRQLAALAERLPGEITALEKQVAAPAETPAKAAALAKQLAQAKAQLQNVLEARERWTDVNYEKLSAYGKSLHAKAFCTNTDDPLYRELETIEYQDGDAKRTVRVPKGDVLHQFREDVDRGVLPTVSWLVAPEAFSDHPGSAWYGAWYIAEALNILTKNPEVWKKTIFLLTYDENDGYFDHVPPFVAPDPSRPETGAVSKGADANLEFVTLEQDAKRKPRAQARESSIGLGYRVPMVIASPWSRGGNVCSQVLDHTSPLQFLEKLLTHRTGKKIEESNISPWRRAVCGDLTSSFKADDVGGTVDLVPLPRDAFVEEIYNARFKKLPGGYRAWTEEEVKAVRKNPRAGDLLPSQEPGQRPSTPLPYELVVDGGVNKDRKQFEIYLAARDLAFGERAAGSPFTVYARNGDDVKVWNYAVAAGEQITGAWPLSDFAGSRYNLAVYGPNGFHRAFTGGPDDPVVEIRADYQRARHGSNELNGDLEVRVKNRDARKRTIELVDLGYGSAAEKRELDAGAVVTFLVKASAHHGWHDFSVRVDGYPKFEKRYAGRVETGKWSISDPAMAGDRKAAQAILTRPDNT